MTAPRKPPKAEPPPGLGAFAVGALVGALMSSGAARAAFAELFVERVPPRRRTLRELHGELVDATFLGTAEPGAADEIRRLEGEIEATEAPLYQRRRAPRRRKAPLNCPRVEATALKADESLPIGFRCLAMVAVEPLPPPAVRLPRAFHHLEIDP